MNHLTGVDGGNAVLVALVFALGLGLGEVGLLVGKSLDAGVDAHALLVLDALLLVLDAVVLAILASLLFIVYLVLAVLATDTGWFSGE